MKHYGNGWHWQSLGDERAALVPLSTAYPCAPLRWQHVETCAIDRVSGIGCTCKQEASTSSDR